MALDMKGKHRFEYAYSLAGSDKPMYRRFRIATDTVIERGEFVQQSEGLIIAMADDTSPSLGIAKDPHDGSSDGQTGLFIDVYCSPDAVFRCVPQSLGTAEAGSGANTIVDASYSGADNVFNGGYVKCVDCANIADGTVIRITDFVTATGTFTTASGTFATDDTFLVFPPEGAILCALDSDGTNLSLTTMDGEIFTVVEIDPDKDETVLVTLNEHILAADLT